MANLYLKKAQSGSGTRQHVETTVRDMLADIGARGDAAVRDYAVKLDRWKSETFRVSDSTIRDVELRLPETFKQDFDFCLRTWACEFHCVRNQIDQHHSQHGTISITSR